MAVLAGEIMQAFYTHHSKVPPSLWRWPSFAPSEIASRGNGSILIDFDAMDKLQRARELCGKPFVIHSAYRDDMHNAMVGGKPRSYHLEGRAFDIGLTGHTKEELLQVLKEAGFTGFGLHYVTFVHADTGSKREW
jgi:uncharacterized protein YcbK (DUF882 family)